jgi:Na+-transporting NADH:ubiquinone oxidoreductase subunit C
MYGLLALEPDGTTVRGIKFYEHGETPGLGGEIDNPRWRSVWPGKKVYGEKGEVRLSVVKGRVDPGAPNAEYRIDGLAGATLTSRGVSNTIEYWLGENAFKPFLERIREQSDSA